MADVQGLVVEPDVGFGADAAVGEGGVEGEGAPVVVVGVDGFLEEGKGGLVRLFRFWWGGGGGGGVGGERAEGIGVRTYGDDALG